MKNLLSLGVAALVFTLSCEAQEPSMARPTLADPASVQQPLSTPSEKLHSESADERPSSGGAINALPATTGAASRTAGGNFSYYLTETYLNASLFTAPAFRASLRMANPPGSGPSRYPDEWRQGAAAFGRNYGDAFAMRISTHTAQFLAGTLTREDLHYTPSSSQHFFMRTSHALAFTFVDRSESGRCMPAFSNFAGAAAGGWVGNAYLPDGFTDLTHAGQRAEFQFGMMAAGNLFRYCAPQMPALVREFLLLIAR